MIGTLAAGAREVIAETAAAVETAAVETAKVVGAVVKETAAIAEKAAVGTVQGVEQAIVGGEKVAVSAAEKTAVAAEQAATKHVSLSKSAAEGFHLGSGDGGNQERERPNLRWHFEMDHPPSPSPEVVEQLGHSAHYIDLQDRPRLVEGWISDRQFERDPAATRKVSGPFNEIDKKNAPDIGREVTFHGSHILALEHGGTNNPDNIVALPSENNVSASEEAKERKKQVESETNTMRFVENQINEHLKSGDVYSQTYIHGYHGDTRIPTEMTVRLFRPDEHGNLEQLGDDYKIYPTRVH
jgi:hypothetical protein